MAKKDDKKKTTQHPNQNLALASLGRVDRALEFAEAKVGFLIAFISLLIGLLADEFPALNKIVLGAAGWPRTLAIAGAVLMAVGTLAVLVFTLAVVIPRLKITPMASFMFFGSVERQTEEEFIQAFKNLKGDEFLAQTLSQAHAVSQIAMTKFENIKRAIYAATAVFLGWLMALLALFLNG